MLSIGQLFKLAIPFIIGLLVGAGLTKNPWVLGMIIVYIIAMFLFSLLRDKIIKVKDSVDKKEAIKHETIETFKDFGEVTLKGNERGGNIFDKYYGEYIFYFNVALFLSLFVLMYYQLWLWCLVCFLGLQFNIALNQVIRINKEIKSTINNQYDFNVSEVGKK
jgi:K+-transporting ATPase A subunit